jgi:glycine/D-amino acid oxidase-like deaminating enzyme/nitrite reductase/ring-hydroxylating ferredoxin subunit
MSHIDIFNNQEDDFNFSDSEGDITSGATNSYWINSSVPISYTSLKENINAEVVIVGGGIAGITTAYLLAKQGRRVVVIEDGNIGSGETGRTTAHIVNALDDRYYELEEKLGQVAASLAAQSHTAAIMFIEKTVLNEGITCDFEILNGYLFPHETDSSATIQREYEATHRVGINTEILDHVPGIPAEDTLCLKYPDQAQFHPLKYLKGLCDIITSMGGLIFTGTHAQTINAEGIVTTEGFKVSAKYIVVATNSPVNNKVVMHTKQAPYRTYVIGAKVPKDSLPKALWWDTGEQNSKYRTMPYHYVRLSPYDHKHDLLIVGGEDHKTGQQENEIVDRFSKLKEWAMQRFPIRGIEYKWSGQVMEPVDRLGFIGRNPMDSDNIFIVTGDSGNGITHGTIAGMLISDLINDVPNPWEKLYDPSRITLSSSKDFIDENLDVISHYAELLTGVPNPDEILSVNKGTVIRDGMKKLAIFRDEFGELHAYNAICPHMKCVVHWNEDEKSFDCPCHGSRFTCFGKVVNGPANSDLKSEKIPDNAEVYEKIYAQKKRENPS